LVVQVTLRADYHVVLDHKLNGSTEVSVDPFINSHRSDGRRILVGSLPCAAYFVFPLKDARFNILLETALCTHLRREQLSFR